jgi:NAD(P)H-hydrate repair Nnr-like enzyme with NAD(P)H-hydrate dehydratase domain
MYRKSLFRLLHSIKPQSIAIGPGLGQETETQKAVLDFLKAIVPLVIDADALNILSINKEWLALLQPKTILTPHPKELERLIGKWNSEEEEI